MFTVLLRTQNSHNSSIMTQTCPSRLYRDRRVLDMECRSNGISDSDKGEMHCNFFSRNPLFQYSNCNYVHMFENLPDGSKLDERKSG